MSLFFIKRRLWRATFFAGWPHPCGWAHALPVVGIALGFAGTLASQRAVGAVLVRPASDVAFVSGLPRWAEALPGGWVTGSSSAVAPTLAALSKPPVVTAFVTVDTLITRRTNALPCHGIAACSIFTGACMKTA